MSASALSPSSGACDDGDPCTVGDACAGGACVPGPATDCDDGRACTFDSCDGLGGCDNGLLGGWCLIDQACVAEGVVGCLACDPASSTSAWTEVAAPCDDGDACTFGDVCESGVCAPGADKICDDANACTDDTCAPVAGCVFTPNTVPCDDGDACTDGDACSDGGCVGGTPICECTVDSDCPDDGNACTAPAVCTDNSCVAAVVVCDPPSAPCLAAQCDPGTGLCLDVPDAEGAACDDGDACTTATTCVSGVCSGITILCDDDNPCTDDACVAGAGCEHTNNAATQPCYDGPADTEGVGACVTGTRTCADGVLGDCTGQVLPADQEQCDGTDDDCDGETDELFAGLGDPCDGPDDDACPGGVTICDASGLTTTCFGDGPIEEACNGIDDDCDDDGDGFCDAALEFAAGTSCANGPGDCDDENPAIHPLAADTPDTSTIDSNCDGVDGDASKAVFVSALCGAAGAAGTSEAPLADIQAAIDLAADQGKTQVLIDASFLDADGFVAYGGGLSLASGVGLYGRYRAHDAGGACHLEWTRASSNVTRIRGEHEVSTSFAWGVQAFDLPAPVTLQWLRIEAALTDPTATASPGRSVYGLLVRSSAIDVEACHIQAERGGDGAVGAEGADGEDGNAGEDGEDGAPDALGPAGAGAPPKCSGGLAGGDAGDGGIGWSWGQWGQWADGSNGGDGGKAQACTAVIADKDTNGKNGENGQDGDDGSHGPSAGSKDGEITASGLWVGIFGSPGTQGTDGRAGGGGGGGGGGVAPVDNAADLVFGGGGGGGGGSGGCAGEGGHGGSPGGGSFALFLIKGGPAVPNITVWDSTLEAGDGGDGGKGGNRGNGGAGGAKGMGGAHQKFQCSKQKSSGKGGNGGTGGNSFTVFSADFDTAPTVTNTTLSFGAGGGGGKHGQNGESPAVDGEGKDTNVSL